MITHTQTAQAENKKLFTVKIQCKVMRMTDYSKVKYIGEEQGIPVPSDAETAYESGASYTIVSPLSPYALGGNIHAQLCAQLQDGEGLSDRFYAEVDFKNGEVSVWSRWQKNEVSQ